MKIMKLLSRIGTVAVVGVSIATTAKDNRIRAENQELKNDKVKLLKQIEQLQIKNQSLIEQEQQEQRNQAEIREEILTRIEIASNEKAQEKIETMENFIKQFFLTFADSKQEVEKAKRQRKSTLKAYQAMDRELTQIFSACLEFSKKILNNVGLEKKGETI